jgi:NADPH:quinone reductase-like Zn-dependent oxidoreductase
MADTVDIVMLAAEANSSLARPPRITSDGGYAEYMIADASAVALVPEVVRSRRGAADVRRNHDLQLPAKQRRKTW